MKKNPGYSIKNIYTVSKLLLDNTSSYTTNLLLQNAIMLQMVKNIILFYVGFEKLFYSLVNHKLTSIDEY